MVIFNEVYQGDLTEDSTRILSIAELDNKDQEIIESYLIGLIIDGEYKTPKEFLEDNSTFDISIDNYQFFSENTLSWVSESFIENIIKGI